MSVSSGSMSIGVLAILTGLVGSYAFRALLLNEPEPEAKAPPTFILPLATADLPANRTILLGDVGLVPMTNQVAAERKFNMQMAMMSPQNIIGRTLKSPVRRMQPFLTTDLYLEGDVYDFTTNLKPGFRAYTLLLPDANASTVSAGAFVDITFRSVPQPSKDGNLGIPEVTMTLLQSIEVLFVDVPKAKNDRGNVGLDIRRYDGVVQAPPSTITLAVTPEQMHMLEVTRGHGSYFLARRPPDDTIVSSSKGVEKNDLYKLLGIKAPEPPSPPAPPVQPFLTERFSRGSKSVSAYDPYTMVRDLQVTEHIRQGGKSVGQEIIENKIPAVNLQRAGQPQGDAEMPYGPTPAVQPSKSVGPMPSFEQGAKPATNAVGTPRPLGGGTNPADRSGPRDAVDPFSEGLKKFQYDQN